MDERGAHDTLMWMLDLYTRPLIGVAVRLNIPDLLAESARTADELAMLTGQHSDALARMLRALSARGVFSEMPDGRYGLTPLSELLRTGVPGSLRATALWRTTESATGAAAAIGHSIKTGEPAVVAAFEKSFFQNLASRETDLEIFTALMASGANPGVHGNRHELAARSGAFHGGRVVVDVAGGRGQLLAEVLRLQPEAQGILLDREEVISTAGELLQRAGVLARVQLVSGDFFREVPGGGDIYVLSLILHDWNDDQCLTILENIRAVAAPDARLLVAERVLPARGETSQTFDHDTMQDINMMAGPGGQERTLSEYISLFEQARFRFRRDWPTGSPMHVLEAQPT